MSDPINPHYPTSGTLRASSLPPERVDSIPPFGVQSLSETGTSPIVSLNSARMVIVEQVSHQSPNQPPTVVDSRYPRILETDEQVYKRSMKIKSEWTNIDVGWLIETGVAQIVIENREGQALQVIPTQEEKAAFLARILELGIEVEFESDKPRDMFSKVKIPNVIVPFSIIRPGESTRLDPSTYIGSLRIRCMVEGETAQTWITAIPK